MSYKGTPGAPDPFERPAQVLADADGPVGGLPLQILNSVSLMICENLAHVLFVLLYGLGVYSSDNFERVSC